jgi:O-antigen ligase
VAGGQGQGRFAVSAPRFVPLTHPRLAEGALLAALAAVPFLFDSRTVHVFEPEKAALVRTAGLLALAAALAGAWWREGPARPQARPLAWAAVAYVLALLLSAALAVDPGAALLGSEHRQHGLLTTLALVLLGWAASRASREGVVRGLGVIAVASVPVAGYAIAQHQGLDPLPWAQDTALRVTGSLGHPAFLAGYLMMALPIVLGRLVAFASGLARGWPLVRFLGYAAILAVDAAAFVFAGSRGPWLGLGVALAVFFLALGLAEGRRRLALGAAGAALAGLAGLALLNLPGGPLERLREGEGIGRLAHLLDAESGTVRGRVLIWRASMERLASAEPLAQADGRPDRWAALRPWVGYGPEAFTPALLPFYPPELAHIEKEHPIPDRAHNDLLDAAVGGGLLGLLAHLALVVAALMIGGRQLGLGPPARIAAVVLGGGVGGLLLAWVTWGVPLAAVGLGLGLVAGFAALLVVAAIRWRREPGGGRRGDGAVLAALLAGLAGHLVETQFGLATVTTRLTAVALLGWLVAWGAEHIPDASPAPRIVPLTAGLGALLGLTVAYGFLGPALWSSRVGIVLLLATGPCAALLALDERAPRWTGVVASMAGTLVIAGAGAAAMAWVEGSAAGMEELARAQRAALLPAILAAAFVAAAIAAGHALGGGGGLRTPLAWGLIGGVLLAAAGTAGALRFWRADVMLAGARRLGDVGEDIPAEGLYQAAWRLAPFRDAIPAGAARVLVETGRITVEEAERDALLDRADGYLAEASARAPMAWAHAADRARLQLLWAGLTVEPPLRQRRLDQADRYYRAALHLHPRSPAVWNEWAVLALVAGAPDEARLRLRRSLELDPRLDQTHRLLRELERGGPENE